MRWKGSRRADMAEQRTPGPLLLRDWAGTASRRMARWRSNVQPRLTRVARLASNPTIRLFGAGRRPGPSTATALPNGLPLTLRMKPLLKKSPEAVLTVQSKKSVRLSNPQPGPAPLALVPEPLAVSQRAQAEAAPFEGLAPDSPAGVATEPVDPVMMPEGQPAHPRPAPSFISRASQLVLRVLRRPAPETPSLPQASVPETPTERAETGQREPADRGPSFDSEPDDASDDYRGDSQDQVAVSSGLTLAREYREEDESSTTAHALESDDLEEADQEPDFNAGTAFAEPEGQSESAPLLARSESQELPRPSLDVARSEPRHAEMATSSGPQRGGLLLRIRRIFSPTGGATGEAPLPATLPQPPAQSVPDSPPASDSSGPVSRLESPVVEPRFEEPPARTAAPASMHQPLILRSRSEPASEPASSTEQVAPAEAASMPAQPAGLDTSPEAGAASAVPSLAPMPERFDSEPRAGGQDLGLDSAAEPPLALAVPERDSTPDFHRPGLLLRLLRLARPDHETYGPQAVSPVSRSPELPRDRAPGSTEPQRAPLQEDRASSRSDQDLGIVSPEPVAADELSPSADRESAASSARLPDAPPLTVLRRSLPASDAPAAGDKEGAAFPGSFTGDTGIRSDDALASTSLFSPGRGSTSTGVMPSAPRPAPAAPVLRQSAAPRGGAASLPLQIPVAPRALARQLLRDASAPARDGGLPGVPAGSHDFAGEHFIHREETAISYTAPDAAPEAAPGGASAQPADPAADQAKLARLAQQVFQELRTRLIVERERAGIDIGLVRR